MPSTELERIETHWRALAAWLRTQLSEAGLTVAAVDWIVENLRPHKLKSRSGLRP